jgi:hypothetical protein
MRVRVVKHVVLAHTPNGQEEEAIGSHAALVASSTLRLLPPYLL